VAIRIPEVAKKAVRDLLSSSVMATLREEPTEEIGIWSVKGIIAQDASVDQTLLQLEKGLVEIEQALGLSGALFPHMRRVSIEHNGGYQKASETHFNGGCFVVARPARPVTTDQGQTVLRITAGQAFGDGSHGSTRIALKLITCLFQDFGKPPPATSEWCLDAGCGTGVLALAVAAIWMGRVLAVDISPEAIGKVRTNQVSNPLWGHRVFPVLGGLTCCGGPFAIIMANLVPSVHVHAHEALWQALKPGGWLIVAGFQETQHDLAAGFFLSKGAKDRARCCEQGWMGVLLQKPTPSCAS
jgi:ribosomal protein L11 methyltransferase